MLYERHISKKYVFNIYIYIHNYIRLSIHNYDIIYNASNSRADN